MDWHFSYYIVSIGIFPDNQNSFRAIPFKQIALCIDQKRITMPDPNNSQQPHDWSGSSADSTSELEASSQSRSTEPERTQDQSNRFVPSSHITSQYGEIPGSNSCSDEDVSSGHNELRRNSRPTYINREPQQNQSCNINSDSDYPHSIHSSSGSSSSQSQLSQSHKGKAPATHKKTCVYQKSYGSLNEGATKSKKHYEPKQRKMSSQTFSPQGSEESRPLLQAKAGCSSDYHPNSFSPDEERGEVDSSNAKSSCSEPLTSVGDEDEDAVSSEMANSNGEFSIQYNNNHISTFTERRKSARKAGFTLHDTLPSLMGRPRIGQ